MSYGQPPTKTPYGDQDFIKEDAPSLPQAQPPFANRNYGRNTPGNAAHQALPQQTPYGQAMPPADGITRPTQMDAQDLAAKVQSLTPEDRVFLRSWRQDSFYFRVLPLAVAGSGGLYYYNHIKNLPHKSSRYLIVSFLSYVIGKWSYKNELARRLEITPLNTPFIQALREITGVRQALSSEFSGDTTQDYSDWNASEQAFPRASPPFSSGSSYSQTPHTAYGQNSLGPQDTYRSYESDLSSPPPSTFSGEPAKTFTSYEELRAKNRGLIQK